MEFGGCVFVGFVFLEEGMLECEFWLVGWFGEVFVV